MRLCLTLSFLLAGPALALSADDPPAEKKGDQPTSPEDRYKALSGQYAEQYQAWLQKVQEAEGEDRTKLIQERPGDEIKKQMLELAKEHPATEGGRQAIVWSMQNGPTPEASKELLALMEEHHAKAEEAGDLALTMQYAFGYDPAPFLRKVVEENPNSEARGKAAFTLGKYLLRQTGRGGEPDPEAERMLELVQKDYADVPYYGERTLGDVAGGALFEIRNLQIGMKAPDIEGEDVEGTKFNLSDYRGKVVVLDFWGDW